MRRRPSIVVSRIRDFFAVLVFSLALIACALEEEDQAISARQMGVQKDGAGVIGLAGSYSYSASNTNYAQQNTANMLVALAAGSRITVGTCGFADSSFSGDTWLRFFAPNGLEIASNDDACLGFGSNLTLHTTVAGIYEIRAGCYSSTSCSGTVVWESSRDSNSAFFYSASDTDHARQNTVDYPVAIGLNQRLTAATCGPPGSAFSGDTYLVLTPEFSNYVLASSHDACGGDGAVLEYVATSEGNYKIRAGCHQDTSCSGAVVWGTE